MSNSRLSQALIDDAATNRKKHFYSQSLAEQIAVEVSVESCFQSFLNENPGGFLRKDEHIAFLSGAIGHLSVEHQSQDSSKPWLAYWVLQSIALLKDRVSEQITERVLQVLGSCQNPSGGFGGGPGQISHLAASYAAVNAIAILGQGFDVIDRPKMREWLHSLKDDHDHSFRMHEDGESDIRAVYCALSICRLLNIGLGDDLLFDEKTLIYILACQTYEGGFAGTPGGEAHRGYTFCGLAALGILGKIHLCNYDNALRWSAMRQMEFEGGFQGRTNKLVDGCYSFWVGVLFNLLDSESKCDDHEWMFDQIALQEYILYVCQNPKKTGGLIDKPGKEPDYYHTCYTLSGLSVAQHGPKDNNTYLKNQKQDDLAMIHPLHNIPIESVVKIELHFQDQGL